MRLTGRNPLAYMGVDPTSPNNFIVRSFAPTVNDWQNFFLGDEWLDSSTQTVYKLVSLASNQAIWVAFTVVGEDVKTLTGDSGGAVSPDDEGNINIFGGNNITVAGDPGLNELIVNVSGTTTDCIQIGNASGSLTSLSAATDGQIPIGSTGVAPVMATITAGSGISITNGAGSIEIASSGAATEFLSGNDATTAMPSSGVITFTGASGNTITASGSTVTITGSGSNPATSFITSPSTGTATPASGVLTFAGTGDTTVSASGSTVTINSTGGGGSGITTIDGNIGSVTGSTVTIYTGTANANGTSGFINSGTVSTLVYDDSHGNLGLGTNTLKVVGSVLSQGNIALGESALEALNNANYNIAIGLSAGALLNPSTSPGINSENNVIIGTSSCQSMTQGYQNIIIGSRSAQNLTTGYCNIAIGSADNTGSNPVAINYTSSERFNIVLNSTGVTGDQNALRIGDSSGTLQLLSEAHIGGISTAVISGVGVIVGGTGGNQLGVSSSSKRFKKNIKDMQSISDVIYKLRPVTFNWDKDSAKGLKEATDNTQYGLIAEEVIEVLPDIVNKDKDGKVVNINYNELISLLLNELQKQNERIKVLEKKSAI